MKLKNKTNRPITAPIQLITQSNDYKFIPQNFLKERKFGLMSLYDKRYKGPVREFDVDEQGFLHDEDEEKKTNFKEVAKDPKSRKKLLKYWDKMTNYKTIQKITIYHINDKGLFYDNFDLQKFPARLYLKFVKSTTDQEISSFIEKNYDFCDFPSPEEQKNINEKDTYLKKFVPTERNKIRTANWLHLYRKHSALSRIVNNFSKNELTQRDLNFLFEQIKLNVIEIPMDRNRLALKEIKDYDEEFKETLEDIFTDTKIKDTNPTIGYRVFGHFALCCLELLKDIEKSEFIKFCTNQKCRKQLPINSHGNQKFCNKKDNPECYKQWRKEARKRDRLNIKIRKRAKNKGLPKMNL